MRKAIGSWLSGPNSVRETTEDRPRWRGERYGLPESGVGSAAPTGRRALGFFLDIISAGLVAGLFTVPEPPRLWSVVVWLFITVIPVAFFGMTPGMAATGIWVTHVNGKRFIGVPKALVRCVLTFVIIPAVMWDLDGRSWHDRLTGTVVVRSRV
jgi:uncharacterized RDD family membrane protein YckC